MNAPTCPKCGAFDTSAHAEELFTPDVGTRHYALLNSNEAPLECDRPMVQSEISKTEARLASLDDEISRLRDRLQWLEEERVSLSTYRAQNNAILSPFRRMPPEVLGEIFSWTLPSVQEALMRLEFDVSDSPWGLSQVSSRWRAVVLSIPSLWSLVAIDYINAPFYPLPLLKTQIQRAHGIHIHIYGGERTDSLHLLEAFQCLADHAERWEELCIELTSDLIPLLNTLHHRLFSLRKLWIEWGVRERQIAAQSTIHSFQTASSLFDVGILNRDRPLSILLPAQQLTRYNVDGPWQMHRSVLMLALNLVQARIDIPEDESLEDGGEIIELLLLEHLYVSQAESLRYLRAPAVEDLGHYIVEDDEPDFIPHLEAFVVRSNCTLRRICLQGTPPARATAEILRKFPSISELAIIANDPDQDWDTTDEMVNGLISYLTILRHPAENVVLAPQLSKICFACEEESYIDYSRYLQMLQSRWKTADCALKSAALVIDLEPRLEAATRRGLEALALDGLELFLLEGQDAKDVIRCWAMCS
ncbi:hypothetical protein FB451DRAFT_110236 [Mycena latifolia]|nr:hypothetical protein FB451DRAFT_110236 [Mycena latifolia]